MTTPVAPQLVSSTEIRAGLSRILASPEFAASRQLTSFLRYVVEELLVGREGRLKERTLALCALGRDANFDPRLDCIVRVVAGKLRRALDRYYAIDGACDPLRIEVPKGSYCPVIRRRWPNSPSDCQEPVRGATGSRQENWPARRPVVVVVPFFSFTNGPEERFLADVLAEDLAVQLSRLSSFEIIDYRTMHLPEADAEEPSAVASRLGADFVMAGTVGRVERRVHLTVRLTDVHSGALIWADRYEAVIDAGRLEQESSIVNRVVATVGGLFDALRCTGPRRACLTPPPRRPNSPLTRS